MTGYQFRKITRSDLALLGTWLSRPHLRKWWDAEPYSAADLEEPRVARWIVSHQRRPFAFMQDYTVHGWPDHHFASLPEGARGIDQYIGEPDMLGLGHGTAFIGQRMQALFDASVPVIATDPHPENSHAIAVYRKLGFVPLGPPQETRWGLILPMAAHRPAEQQRSPHRTG